jgi:hypothetical protein
MIHIKIKLKWYKDIEGGETEEGVDKAVIWRSSFGHYLITVYPVKLYDKKLKGWEYRIYNTKTDEETDSIEGSYGNDHARTPKEAMRWAEEELEEMIEEERKEQWEKLKKKLKGKIKE